MNYALARISVYVLELQTELIIGQVHGANTSLLDTKLHSESAGLCLP